MATRAAVYLRQSKDASGDAAAVERQRDDCMEIARKRGWEVVATFTDNDTSAAGKRARPGFDALLRSVESGEVAVVVAWAWDRLSRNRRDEVRLIEVCQARSATVALENGSDLDLTTPAGVLTADILASVARNEIATKAARQRAAQTQAAKAGRPPSRRAFGYLPGGTEIHPQEGPAVEEVFTRFLGGASLAGLRKWLNAQELWTTGGKPWTSPAVRVMLRNPRYAGIRAYRSEEVGPGTWPAIVSEDVWRAAVDRLADPARKVHSNGAARKWLGSFLYVCGRCGAPMTCGYRGLAGNMKRTYRCSANVSHLTRLAEPVDAYVEARIVERLRRPDVRALLAGDRPDLKPLRAERRTLQARLERFERDYHEGLIDGQELKRARDHVTGSLTLVEERLTALTRDQALARLADAPDPGAAWLGMDDVAARQTVVRALATITLQPITTKGRKPFNPASVLIEPV